MVSRSSNRGAQSSVARMRLTSATMVMMSPARRVLHGEGATGYAADRLDRFQHGIAAAVAAIQRHGGSAVAQVGQRCAMGLCEIADVDEIADAASVGCRIVGAVNVDLIALAGCGFHRNF